jgi:hypothetical protein
VERRCNLFFHFQSRIKAGFCNSRFVRKNQRHTNVKTTQIYAKVVDEKKEKAAHAIKLKIKNQVTVAEKTFFLKKYPLFS